MPCSNRTPPSTLFHVTLQRKGPGFQVETRPGPSGSKGWRLKRSGGKKGAHAKARVMHRNGSTPMQRRGATGARGAARARALGEKSPLAQERTCRIAGSARALPRCPRAASARPAHADRRPLSACCAMPHATRVRSSREPETRARGNIASCGMPGPGSAQTLACPRPCRVRLTQRKQTSLRSWGTTRTQCSWLDGPCHGPGLHTKAGQSMAWHDDAARPQPAGRSADDYGASPACLPAVPGRARARPCVSSLTCALGIPHPVHRRPMQTRCRVRWSRASRRRG